MQPVKGVFGRMLCDTDGSIGDPTEFDAERALEIIAECERLAIDDQNDLEKVRRWAEQGKALFAVWQH